MLNAKCLGKITLQPNDPWFGVLVCNMSEIYSSVVECFNIRTTLWCLYIVMPLTTKRWVPSNTSNVVKIQKTHCTHYRIISHIYRVQFVEVSLSYLIQVVTLEFTDFHLESDPDCDNDWLKVYSGPSSSSGLIGKYCGDTGPASVTSSSPDIYIHFHSDVSDQYKGAHFQWQAVGELYCCL